MPALVHLPCRDEQGNIHVVVESPRGSTVKLKYEPSLECFTFGRALPLGVAYPYDWGFVPSTCASDGDPLDAMVLSDLPTSLGTGIVVPARPIGLVRLTQRDEDGHRMRNDRVIAVPYGDDRYDHVDDLPKRVRHELERFFIKVSEMTKKDVKIDGWAGPKAAREAVEKAATAYVRGHTPK